LRARSSFLTVGRRFESCRGRHKNQ
jgi:hypothetical protein